MTWFALEVYDTEQRDVRCRRYTRSAKKAAAWERIPRIDFTDSGHGLVFTNRRTPTGPNKQRPTLSPHAYHQHEVRQALKERLEDGRDPPHRGEDGDLRFGGSRCEKALQAILGWGGLRARTHAEGERLTCICGTTWIYRVEESEGSWWEPLEEAR